MDYTFFAPQNAATESGNGGREIVLDALSIAARILLACHGCANPIVAWVRNVVITPLNSGSLPNGGSCELVAHVMPVPTSLCVGPPREVRCGTA